MRASIPTRVHQTTPPARCVRVAAAPRDDAPAAAAKRAVAAIAAALLRGGAPGDAALVADTPARAVRGEGGKRGGGGRAPTAASVSHCPTL